MEVDRMCALRSEAVQFWGKMDRLGERFSLHLCYCVKNGDWLRSDEVRLYLSPLLTKLQVKAVKVEFWGLNDIKRGGRF